MKTQVLLSCLLLCSSLSLLGEIVIRHVNNQSKGDVTFLLTDGKTKLTVGSKKIEDPQGLQLPPFVHNVTPLKMTIGSKTYGLADVNWCTVESVHTLKKNQGGKLALIINKDGSLSWLQIQ